MNPDQIEKMLRETSHGEGNSVEEAVALVYNQLRAVAANHLRNERPDHSFQATALVHEAYVRLAEQTGLSWQNRVHFIHIASNQIRRVLVDHARRRGRKKRGGESVRVTLSDAVAQTEPSFDVIALNDALDRLDKHSTEDRKITELKYFGGLTEAEIAVLMGISERSVRRRWSFARAWLFKELNDSAGDN